MKQKPIRLDLWLVELGLVDSREQARRLIMAGEVMIDGRRALKASEKAGPENEVEVRNRPQFVGRGGLKLAGALDSFGIDPAGKVCADLGASTGGFTDCLLQRGAAKVYAIDVGHNQLAWKIRSHSQVMVMEGVNARHLESLPEPIDFCVMDLSFISLTRVLPAAFSLLSESGEIVALVKPQFELDRASVGKGGVVREPERHQEAVRKVVEYVENSLDKHCRGVSESPLQGADGNREFFVWLSHKSD